MKHSEHRIHVRHRGLLSGTQLRHYFSDYGEILDVYVPKDSFGNNKNFAFITFATHEAKTRSQNPARHLIDGIPIQVNPAHKCRTDEAHRYFTAPPQQQFGAGPRLYVTSPDKLAVDQVRDYFTRWGKVLDVYFLGDSRFRRGSYCFVTFESFHCAHQAWAQAERRIDSQPLHSISIAEDRTQHQTSPPDCLSGNTAAFAHQATTYTDACSSKPPLAAWKEDY